MSRVGDPPTTRETRVDYVNGHDEFDSALWFVDGRYVGHDDQYEVQLLVAKGTSRVIDFHHRELRPGLPEDAIDELVNVNVIADVERFLVPE